MEIITPVKLVPDQVEELRIDDQGLGLDPDWLRLKLNEFDDHAIEQAVLLKEGGLGRVTVIAQESECTEDVLFNAAARGVDRLLRLSSGSDGTLNNHALAHALAPLIQSLHPDLVLTGVQAHNDLDGALGPILAEYLGLPYVGYVSGVKIENEQAVVRKEFPGGLVGELVVDLPAVLGIQAAEQPPRYVAFSKVRQAMKEARIEDVPVSAPDQSGAAAVTRLYKPETGQQAEIIDGDPEDVASQFVQVLTRLGVI